MVIGALVVTMVAFVATAAMLWRSAVLLMDAEAGPRTRRLRGWRMMFWVGWWEVSVAAVLVASPGPAPTAISVGGFGAAILLMVWFSKRIGVPI